MNGSVLRQRRGAAGDLDLRRAFLDPAVKQTPLVDRWYAWPHLLSPAQQALNLAFRYLPIMHSFIAAPTVHAAASADPTLYGGPFLDLPAGAVDLARAYVERVERERANALAFARTLRQLDARLQTANGYSLDEYREGLPEVLRGRVELVYDLNDHPKLRLLEEMFEEDDLGLANAQEILLHREADTVRPFFLSTPRLQTRETLYVKTPFGSDAAAMLGAAHHRAVDLTMLARQLEQPVAEFAPYFTNERGTCGSAYDGEGVRVRYFGHACVLIETTRSSILVDPTTAYDRHDSVEHFVFDDLPAHIDVLLISHSHQDHFVPEFLLRLRERVGLVVVPGANRGELSDPSLRRMLRRLGYTRIRTLEPLETMELADGRIMALPFTGEHSDLDVHSKQCALIELKGRRIGLFVDTDAIDIGVYQRIAARLQKPDLAFIGMECFGAPLSWLYGPLISRPIAKKNDHSRRLSGANSQRAWNLVELLHPRRVCVYAMGQEPWMRYLMGLSYTEDSVQLKESNAFIGRCRQSGIAADRLYLKMETTL